MKNKQKCSKTEQRQDKWPETQKLELCPKSVEVRVSSQMLEIRPSLDKLDIWKSLQTTPPLFGFRQPEQIMAVTLASCFFNLEKQRHKISIAQKFICFYHQLLEQTLVSDGSNLSPNEFSQKTKKKTLPCWIPSTHNGTSLFLLKTNDPLRRNATNASRLNDRFPINRSKSKSPKVSDKFWQQMRLKRETNDGLMEWKKKTNHKSMISSRGASESHNYVLYIFYSHVNST